MTNFFNDIASEEDYLGYHPYIEAFNYILTNNNELITPPLVFGIHGKWGSGKTTFMNLIKSRIEKEKNFYTVEINPWEYGQNQNFITVFLAKLYSEIKWKIKIPRSEDAIDFIKSVFKPLKLSLDTKLIKVEYDFEKFSFDQQQNVIDKFISENFALKESISYILNHKFISGKKIIIFIDDLDRCSVDKVMEVIESIKLIFNSKNCIFFLGCDINYIQRALSNKYRDFFKIIQENNIVSSDLSDFSREYLEKIIQIPFNIPLIDAKAIKKYVDSIIENKKVVNKNRRIQVTENIFEKFKMDLKDEFISELVIAMDINPRRIKRILNLTFLNYVFMKFKNVEKNKLMINTKLLAFLCILKEVYPKFYKEQLSKISSCRKTFGNYFEIYKREMENNKLQEQNDRDNSINEYENNDNVLDEENYPLFELYFKDRKIKNSKELNDEIYYIDLYISVSNLNALENDEQSEWGSLSQIRSSITGKKLSVFLQTLSDNVPAKNLVYWFFNDIYLNNRSNYILGIVKNVNIYLNINKSRKWIFKFDFDRKKNALDIIFEGKNGFKASVDDLDKIITSDRYNSFIKKICIDEDTTSDELEKIKDNLLSLKNKLVENHNNE